jgi:hypothetical protein
MAMVFPTSPTVGQVFTSGGRSWVWNGSAWDAPSATNVLQVPYGLELVKAQTIGTGVSSVTVTDAFKADYDDYLITISGGSTSAGPNIELRLGSTNTGYYFSSFYIFYSSTTLATESNSNAAVFNRVARGSSGGVFGNINISQPFNNKNTLVTASGASADTGAFMFYGSGFLNNTISYTDFTLLLNTGTITGGTIKVYGYRKVA